MLKSVVLWENLSKKEREHDFLLRRPVTTGDDDKDDLGLVEVESRLSLVDEFDGDTVPGFSSAMVGNVDTIGRR